jgi:phage tail-like protein
MALASGDVLASYAFEFEVEGVSIAQFSQVSGISSSVGVIEYRSAGKGGTVTTRKLPGQQSNSDVTLSRGKTDSSALWDWYKQVGDGDIAGARRNASLVLFDYEHGEVARYNLRDCWPSSVRIGELSAGSNTVLIEEVVIVHEGMALA